LQVIDLDLNGSFLIERCVDCFGFFFDPGKIESLLETLVSNVFDSNWQHLDAINQDYYQGDKKVKYIKCLACHAFKSRVNFGYRSGVVIDRCTNHGIWLYSGEITHLMEWKKAGGQSLHDRQIATETMKRKNNSGTMSGYRRAQTDYFDNNLETEAFDKILSVISRIFR
jgi:Zn-finger nucleic acid-binding protein